MADKTQGQTVITALIIPLSSASAPPRPTPGPTPPGGSRRGLTTRCRATCRTRSIRFIGRCRRACRSTPSMASPRTGRTRTRVCRVSSRARTRVCRGRSRIPSTPSCCRRARATGCRSTSGGQMTLSGYRASWQRSRGRIRACRRSRRTPSSCRRMASCRRTRVHRSNGCVAGRPRPAG